MSHSPSRDVTVRRFCARSCEFVKNLILSDLDKLDYMVSLLIRAVICTDPDINMVV